MAIPFNYLGLSTEPPGNGALGLGRLLLHGAIDLVDGSVELVASLLAVVLKLLLALLEVLLAVVERQVGLGAGVVNLEVQVSGGTIVHLGWSRGE